MNLINNRIRIILKGEMQSTEIRLEVLKQYNNTGFMQDLTHYRVFGP